MTSLRVRKKRLVQIAGALWLVAGFNVLRLGFLSYRFIGLTGFLLLGSVATFLAFESLFYRLVQKNKKRIMELKETLNPVWSCMDSKFYVIMVFMMSMGVVLRAFHLVPEWFITFFYTGLGLALFLSGILYFYFSTKWQ